MNNKEDNISKFKEPLRPVVVEEKRTNKAPIILSILFTIILIGGVIFGVKYYMNGNNSNTQNEVNNKEDEETKEESKETFTNEELEELLAYIPYELSMNSVGDIFGYNILENVYKNRNTIVEEVNPYALVARAIAILTADRWYDNIVTYEDLANFMKKAFNYDLSKIDFTGILTDYNGTNDRKLINNYIIANGQGIVYNPKEKIFCVFEAGQGINSVENIIDKYEIVNDNLEIYSYAAEFNIYKLIDPYTYKVIGTFEDYNNNKNFVLQHKNEFTLYKHTFKKNNTGYYWYSTEAIEAGNNVDINSIEEKPSGSIVFNDEELEKYLEYVPLYMIYDDVNYPFHIAKFDLNNVSKENIFDTAFLGADSTYWTETTCNLVDNCLPEGLLISDFYKNKENNVYTYSKIYNSNVDLLLHIKYNLKLEDLNFKLSDNKNEFYFIGKTCRISFDNAFLTSQCRGGNGRDILYIIDDYKATSEELDIYSKIILTNSFGYDKDLYTGKDIVIGSDIDTKDYVLQHKNDFTLYKHTFKKNDLGYYWYSTEVVEE